MTLGGTGGRDRTQSLVHWRGGPAPGESRGKGARDRRRRRPAPLEPLKSGAAKGEVIELLPDYEPHVRELAREAGDADRVSFWIADLVADPAAGSPADSRPEQGRLLYSRRRRAGRDRGFARTADAGAQLSAAGVVGTRCPQRVNTYFRVRRRRFRAYLHAPMRSTLQLRGTGSHGRPRATAPCSASSRSSGRNLCQ